ICNALVQMLVRKGTHGHAYHAGLDDLPAQVPSPAVRAVRPEPEKTPVEPAEPAIASAAPVEPSWFEVEIYCVKCRDRRMIRDPETVVLANGRPAYQGS